MTLPGFPSTGRTHLIGHPDPEVRALAAADPTLPEPPVDDADEAVRRAAAANPSLTPETLETLLADPRTAEGAAANPSLPVPRMHALLDRCRVAPDGRVPFVRATHLLASGPCKGDTMLGGQ
ncbi:hypothetical protein ACIBM4_36165 [Streptomyces sp. NPDC050256]|uniref:hypothetical protein n=1 Tax=Streptomyces sp. NPDC050256 TaxID=3365607 RepID=UPI0037B86B37